MEWRSILSYDIVEHGGSRGWHIIRHLARWVKHEGSWTEPESIPALIWHGYLAKSQSLGTPFSLQRICLLPPSIGKKGQNGLQQLTLGRKGDTAVTPSSPQIALCWDKWKQQTLAGAELVNNPQGEGIQKDPFTQHSCLPALALQLHPSETSVVQFRENKHSQGRLPRGRQGGGSGRGEGAVWICLQLGSPKHRFGL